MPFEWAEYLRLAEELAERQNDEAALRSAVSRAYYAAYCKACAYLNEKNIAVPHGEGSHDRVWNSFINLPGRTHTSIQGNGDRLKRRRVIADYKEQEAISTQDAKSAVTTSKNILTWLDQVSGQRTS
ncbi:HEPN domain-containing protein [bacterium]|nr:HEPN domain-containing protein [bacterium]